MSDMHIADGAFEPEHPIDAHCMRGATTMADPIEQIRRLLDDHRIDNPASTAQFECRCGEASLPEHSRHVAQRIVDCLGLRVQTVGNELRYVSAWFDDELTKLEGAE
jgi:hypothetical protein